MHMTTIQSCGTRSIAKALHMALYRTFGFQKPAGTSLWIRWLIPTKKLHIQSRQNIHKSQFNIIDTHKTEKYFFNIATIHSFR